MAGSLVVLLVAGCSTASSSSSSSLPSEQTEPSESTPSESTASSESSPLVESSRVTAVEVTPSGSGYSFSVTVESNDTGCDRHADWWEAIAPSGELYRRILAHSHVDEPPFARSGGPVEVGEDEVVWCDRTQIQTATALKQ